MHGMLESIRERGQCFCWTKKDKSRELPPYLRTLPFELNSVFLHSIFLFDPIYCTTVRGSANDLATALIVPMLDAWNDAYLLRIRIVSYMEILM